MTFGSDIIIAVCLGRPTGHMLLFFILQGLASSVTWRIKLFGAQKLLGFVFTYVFLVISLVFYFVLVNEGVAFYANQIPTWIRPW